MIGFNNEGACFVDAHGLSFHRRRAVYHHATAFEPVALPPAFQPAGHAIAI